MKTSWASEDWPRLSKQIDSSTADQLDPQLFFEKYYHAGTANPVIIRAPKLYESLASRWTDEFLKNQLSNVTVHVYVSADGTFPGGDGPYDEAKYRIVDMSFDECFDRITGKVSASILSSTEKYYLYQNPSELFAPIIDGYMPPPYIPENIKTTTNVWLSGAGAITPLHYDLLDNVLVQLRGTKEVLLWRPDQYPYLYIRPFGEIHSRQSPIDLRHRNYDDFPAFVKAEAQFGTLHSGDILFIPAGWGHYVKTVDLSLSINHWWSTDDIISIQNAVSNILSSLRKELQLLAMNVIDERFGKLIRA